MQKYFSERCYGCLIIFFSNKCIVLSTSLITRKSTFGDINNGNKQKQMDLDKTLEAISGMNYKEGN